MSCVPRWKLLALDGRPVPYPCGGARLCPRPAPDGATDVGVILADDTSVLRRDGEALPVRARPIATGDDGCGNRGALVVHVDPAPFGWHRWTLEDAEGRVFEAERALALGPGAADPTPGLLVGLGLFLAGVALARAGR